MGRPGRSHAGRVDTAENGLGKARHDDALQGALGSGVELDIHAQEEREDSRLRRIAWLTAAAFHILLFMVQFPEMTRQVRAAPAREQKLFVVEQPKFKPPEVQRRQQVFRPSQVRVPIPDPTPDEPEPLREPEPEQTIQLAVRDDSLFGFPSAPPEPGEDGAPIPVGQVREPRRLVEVRPVYPEEARKARLEGVVIVEIIVDKSGNVKDVRVIRPLSMGLTEAAIEAVRQWKYESTTYNGRPVEVLITVTVRFSLQ